MASIEAQLEQMGFLLLAPHGVSMWPLLRQEKDSVLLEPANAQALQVGDVSLYRRVDGQVVLHRIRRVLADGFLMCGDHQWRMEYVPFSCVFGKMTAYYRKEKKHTLQEKGYRRYVRFYCGAPLWLRGIFLAVIHLFRLPVRLFGRLFSKGRKTNG